MLDINSHGSDGLALGDPSLIHTMTYR